MCILHKNVCDEVLSMFNLITKSPFKVTCNGGLSLTSGKQRLTQKQFVSEIS